MKLAADFLQKMLQVLQVKLKKRTTSFVSLGLQVQVFVKIDT
jgi:hypothetical protein